MQRQLDALKAEQSTCRQCYNPNICLYLGATRDVRGNLVLVSELMDIDLNRFIERHARSPPSLYARMSMACYIAMGMSWIEGQVIHTDLKPSNVLLSGLDANGQWTSKSTCKVCDFGLSVVSSIASKVTGTPVYQSPESLNGMRATSKTDVFSYGWICVNLVLWKTERKLFHFIKTSDQLKKFANNEQQRLDTVRTNLAKVACPAVITDMICNCLRGKPDQRPTFKAVVKRFQTDLFLHAAIQVPGSSAMRFWETYFPEESKFEVSFDELLAAMTNEALLNNTDDDRSEFPLSRDKVHFLHLLFVHEQQSTVTLERFGRVCAVLGPFDLPHFVTKVCALAKHRWFYGEMATTTAAYALSTARAGTFLVRFANSRLSDFAISRVYPSEGYIHHLHINHPVESNSFSVATGDVDMSKMTPEQIASVRKTYASLEELVAGVQDALELTEPMFAMPRLLLGQNVKHNGYFVRAFMSDSDDDRMSDDEQRDDIDDSPLELDEDGVITPLLSREYRRAARLMLVADVQNPHKQGSLSSLKARNLGMTFESFCKLTQRTNLRFLELRSSTDDSLSSSSKPPSEGYSITLVTARARSFFRLNLLEMPASKVFQRNPGAPSLPTRDCGGLLSSLSFIQFGLAKANMIDMVFKKLIAWLRVHGDFEYMGVTLRKLAEPVEWEVYLAAVEQGIVPLDSSGSSEALKSSVDEDFNKRRFGDLFLLIAFANLYSLTIICVTDADVAENPNSPHNLAHPEWVPCVYCVEPADSKRFAVVGVTCGGKLFVPLLPQTYFESLKRVLIRNEVEAKNNKKE